MHGNGEGAGLVGLLGAALPDRCLIPTSHRGNFPGLSRADTGILVECLGREQVRPAAWWFDVPVGEDPPWWRGVRLPAFYAKQKHLTALRADMVCVVSGCVWVVEIKPEARGTALGQALLNAYTLKAGVPALEVVRPVILCRWAAPELAGFCRAHDVCLHVIG